ncbi:efflux RND transporter periplasmic adaptor subunit [Arthrobacter antioxidans]|uniref:efflux RND transporter periplasmic adaptor subunit n=1 Tax=Arthrobacter antioxidans TaxID=2895818 RepID=UPI00200023B7|nr:efflux RND transporter periplasmic adaptor subunit [Arthrobacter antioxidans]
MSVLRRVLLPIAWLVVFAVIAVALVKIAFFDGVELAADAEFPTAEVMTPAVAVGLGTVANTVELTGTVAADDGVPVRSTAQGEVVAVFAEQGDAVEEGAALFQVRRPAEIQPTPVQVGEAEEGDDAPAPGVPEPVATVYEYYDILAPADGTLAAFTPLPGESVSIGQTTGTVSPGTYHVSGTLTAAQQFRLLDRPSSAVIAITGGAAPFTCTDPRITEPQAAAGGGPDAGSERTAMAGPIAPAQGPGSDGGSTPAGELTCPIPADVPVFVGLSADIVLSAGVAEDVVTVPTTAVKGSIATGIVWVQDPAGETTEREVKLGLNDGSSVEITEGLAEGDMILEFVPGSDVPLNQGAYPMMGG